MIAWKKVSSLEIEIAVSGATIPIESLKNDERWKTGHFEMWLRWVFRAKLALYQTLLPFMAVFFLRP